MGALFQDKLTDQIFIAVRKSGLKPQMGALFQDRVAD
jgi:hypothetical protein